jgi:2-oxoisovalerate dehydrogenase E1 component alpha subunit
VTDSVAGAPAQQPELVQLLTPEGERVEHPEYSFDPDPETLRGFYRDLVLVRRVDTEATALQRQGELGIWASLLGLYRGVNLGGWDPNAHNFHLYTIVIGAQTLHATGYAMGIQRDGAVGTGDDTRDAAVIAYFGDGATAQGDVNESFVFASVYNAPVVFFCQNNQWAISEPNERQTRIPLYQRARGFGFPGVRVDGNDVLAVHAVTSAALDRARRGEGPTFIEAFTYRMGAHTTSDDPTRYRIAAEVEEWKLKDPIARVKALLSRNGLAEAAFFEEVERDADELAAHVRSECHAMPDPDPDDMFAFAYREPHSLLEQERAWFAEYHASFTNEPVASLGGER